MIRHNFGQSDGSYGCHGHDDNSYDVISDGDDDDDDGGIVSIIKNESYSFYDSF